jgi:16S rRNA (cytidine1402-2'-O)-methyltransferase
VRAAVAEGIAVIPIPGPCAAVTALSASGLPSDTFTFAGFPPVRQGKRRAFLNAMAPLPGTLVFYEAPHRLEESLRDIREVMGDRQVVVARELTKIYEEFIRGTVGEVLAEVAQGKVRGEVVILVAPGEAVQEAALPLHELLERLLHDEGLTVKDAAKKAAEMTGVPKNAAYAEALRVRNGGEEC